MLCIVNYSLSIQAIRSVDIQQHPAVFEMQNTSLYHLSINYAPGGSERWHAVFNTYDYILPFHNLCLHDTPGGGLQCLKRKIGLCHFSTNCAPRRTCTGGVMQYFICIVVYTCKFKHSVFPQLSSVHIYSNAQSFDNLCHQTHGAGGGLQ